jgi:hypothetical protein
MGAAPPGLQEASMKKARALVVAGTAAALGFVGVPAQAAIIDKGIEKVDETTVTDQCGPEIPSVEVHNTGTIAYLYRTRGSEGFAFGSFAGSLQRTFTNPDTGRSWSSTARWFERDSRVLEVSDDGEVITMLVRVVFSYTVFNEAGERDSFDRGVDVFTLNIDTNGTPVYLDDDEVEFGEVLRQYGPRTTSEFCVDAQRFTVD